MTHSDSVHQGCCCCQKIVIQFDGIRNELQDIKQTVDVAVTLLSKLVALTPNDFQKHCGYIEGSSPSAIPDCPSAVNSALRRDSAKEVMGVSLGQTAIMQSLPADVKSRAEIECHKTRIDKVIVEAENHGRSIERGNVKATAEVESDGSISTKNSRTIMGTGNDKGCGQVKNNKLTVVDLSADPSAPVCEHISPSLLTADISKHCGIVSVHTVTPTAAYECDIVAKQLDCQNKETDTLPGPGLSDVTPSRTSPANAVSRVSAPQNVCAEANTEACMDSVRVKREQSSEHDGDVCVYTITADERLRESEEVKVEPEGVFISDDLQPVCVLMKKEDEFCASNNQANDSMSLASRHSTKQFSGQNPFVSSGDKLSARSKDQGLGHVIQDSTCQMASPVYPLLGSTLVSKLKQKIQQKIQAALYAVNEEKTVDEGGSGNLMDTNTCMERSQSFNKDGGNAKELTIRHSKLRQKFYQCKSCAKIFSCKITLHIHKNRCRGFQKQYHCSACPLMFKSRAVLFNHRQLHSAKKSKHRHKCEICGREFILKSTLQKHRQSQLCQGSRIKCYRKLPQHFCSQCGEVFLNSSNLELHQKLHNVGETHSRSSIEGVRGASVQVPRAVRRYPCGYCSEAFIDRRSVALHEKLHTDKEFATFDEERKKILRRHQLTMIFQKQQQQQQSNRKKFGCDVCGRCYSIELLLHMHTRLHHAIS